MPLSGDTLPVPLPNFVMERVLEVWMPVPPSVASSVGVNGELLTTFRLADLAPPVVGAKVTLTVQLAPAASEGVKLAQGVAPPVATLNWVESVPLMVIAEIVTGAVPLFLIVNDTGVD